MKIQFDLCMELIKYHSNVGASMVKYTTPLPCIGFK